MLGTKKELDAARALKYAAGLSLSLSYGSKAGRSDMDDLQASFSWQAQGGNTLLHNSPHAWMPTVAALQHWRVIKQEDVVPLAELIGKIPGYQTVPNEFRTIADGSRKKASVNVKFGVAPEQRKNRDQPEYLSLWVSENAHRTSLSCQI
jgi:hypothetical protein